MEKKETHEQKTLEKCKRVKRLKACMIRGGCPCRPVLELLCLVSAATVTMKDSNAGLNLFWNSEGSNENCKRRAGVTETVLVDVLD